MFLSIKNTKSILTWLICLAYVGMFFSIKLSNITLIVLFLFCLFQTNPRNIVQAIRENLFSQTIIAFYILHAVGLFYTDNMPSGLFELEKKASFVLIPVIALPVFIKFEIEKDSVFRKLGYITIMSSLALLCIAFFRQFVLHVPQAFYYETFPPINYPYYSMYFACGSLFLINSLFDGLLNKRFGQANHVLRYREYGYPLKCLKPLLRSHRIASGALLPDRLRNKKFIVRA